MSGRHGSRALRALDLPDDADERDVRRAYARRLKQIDQAVDPQGFQDLRQAYEAALQEVALRGHEQAEEPALPATGDAAPEPLAQGPAPEAAGPSAPPEEEPPAGEPPAAPEPSPGDEVFREFMGVVASVLKDERAATLALTEALADGRLVNLEACTLFEWRVACLLAEGWRDGHEFLFGPACKALGWEEDRRRLRLFGDVGDMLNRAIDEKLMFFSLPPQQFDACRQVIRRLRSDAIPDTERLRADLPVIQQLSRVYPNWLHVVTSRGNMIRWHQAWEAVPEASRGVADRMAEVASRASWPQEPAPKAGSRFSPQYLFFGLMLLLALGRMLPGLMRDSPPPYEAPRPTSQGPVPALVAPDRSSLVPELPSVTRRPPGWTPYEPPASGAVPRPQPARPPAEKKSSRPAQPREPNAYLRDPEPERLDLGVLAPPPRPEARTSAVPVLPSLATPPAGEDRWRLTTPAPVNVVPPPAPPPAPAPSVLPPGGSERSKYELGRGADGEVSTPLLGNARPPARP